MDRRLKLQAKGAIGLHLPTLMQCPSFLVQLFSFAGKYSRPARYAMFKYNLMFVTCSKNNKLNCTYCGCSLRL